MLNSTATQSSAAVNSDFSCPTKLLPENTPAETLGVLTADVQELLEACKEAQEWMVQAHCAGILNLNWKLDQRLTKAIDRMEAK